MGRELQKRKNRSSRPKVVVPNSRKKALNPMGNNIIAKNWDKKQTLSQNYRRLGIAARLQAPTGGVEVTVAEATNAVPKPKIPSTPGLSSALGGAASGIPAIREARVERDADGRIIRVISSGPSSDIQGFKPLNDPLAAYDSDSDKDNSTPTHTTTTNTSTAASTWEDWAGISDNENDNDVVKALVRQSRLPVAKQTRFQSEQESEWLDRLVAKHGDDVRAMAWDRKLNPFQQTVGDLTKRLKRWRKVQAEKERA
ncbi:Nucleolar protein 16 [Ceratocystis lukuohia]|uniref:Nucleolar protein 16 n=2 Tax=Ceratocystis TaxID=5157 RepID=A0A0F8DAM1_CERFI|nr:Nucleolar protein 16 [Ceratocystis platani]